MDKRKILNITRTILIAASIICLIAALFLTLYEYRREVQTAAEVETPVEVSHRVLFLSSYSPLYFSYVDQAEGLRSSLYPNGVEYDVFFMDTKRYNSDKDIQDFHDFLAARISESDRYEGVIIGDDAALQFALEYQEELFDGLPMIFLGINNPELAETAAENPMVTGFLEKDYLYETLSLAVELKKNATQIVGIHDDTPPGKADHQALLACVDEFPDYRIIEINTSSMTEQEFEEKLKELPSDTILVYMTAYEDCEGNTYSFENRTHMVASNTDLPIFRNYAGGVGIGALGGVSMDFITQGKNAGDTMIEVLNGRDISTIPLDTDTPSRTIFDYQLLKKYDMDRSLLPEDTEYVNRGQTFLERYGKAIPAAILVVVALILLVLGSNMNIALVRIANQDLEDSKKSLQYRADYDNMLGLLNRRAATEQLQDQLKEDSVYSILVIDVDDFKGVNECYGHEFADELLISLSTSLMMMADSGGWLLSRYGGDEFLIMIPDVHLSETDDIVQTLLQLFRTPVAMGEELIIMSASIGICNSDGVTPVDQNIINAEVAMYEAKARGRNTSFIYADEIKRKVREENQIKAKLLSAFDNDGFFMVYQPQIDSQTLEISGFEALVRMKEPGLYPGQFIPVVERSGWIARLGRVTTELSIRQLAAWREEGHTLHPVSVNFSSNQMNDTGFVDFVRELLEKYDIPADYLEIEFTEGLFIERTKQAEDLFAKFKELGVTLLMDDFGTGYSSLGYLTYIPVDIIKLDKSLVDAYLVPEKDAFIHDVINMMHDLGKKVIIEGVEEEWQFRRLREFGADTIQGYYFSKPIPAEEAINFKITGIDS